MCVGEGDGEMVWDVQYINPNGREKERGGRRDSPGLGSVNKEQIDKRTLETVRAGDQLSLRISRQMPPLSLTLQWYIFVWNFTLGGLNG